MIDDGEDIFVFDEEDTVTLSGSGCWSNTSITLGSTGSTGSALRTTLGTVGSLGASNVTWTTPGTITSGGYLTSGGATGPTWTGTATTLTSGNWLGNIHVGDHQAGLRVNGDATFEGDITVKGVSLSDRFDAIEERLGILRPNNDLEGKWEKLKALGDEYRALEKDILEKEKIWDMLKK